MSHQIWISRATGIAEKAGQTQLRIGVKQPDPAEEINQIKTHDPAGIERYWHTRSSPRSDEIVRGST
jgi:hypothetical protein